MSIPQVIDGADVLFYSICNIEGTLGYVEVEGSSKKIIIWAFVIARYKNDSKVYTFSCDKNWDVIADSLFDSIEDAMKYKENTIGVINWISLK